MNSSNRPVALVTGASSGIGAALARELARRGHDLVLSARRLEPMEALAEELRQLGAAATIVIADLARPDGAASLLRDLESRGLEVEVLINNAGLGRFARFDRTDATRIDEMMQVNMVALTQLTHALLAAMQARGRGKIMLVASTASFIPCPNLAVYAATKAYVRSFGEALAEELRGSAITVNVLCPGTTATNFFDVAGGTVNGMQAGRMMSPEAVAKIGVDGLLRGERVTVAGLANRVLAFAAMHTPHFLTLPATAKMLAQE
ncbi:MAG TPA: SDR family oxidoreductase [Stellaceae bacterium]|nr:SDR family oxidoreductase [Stellaceae bacterium]